MGDAHDTFNPAEITQAQPDPYLRECDVCGLKTKIVRMFRTTDDLVLCETCALDLDEQAA